MRRRVKKGNNGHKRLLQKRTWGWGRRLGRKIENWEASKAHQKGRLKILWNFNDDACHSCGIDDKKLMEL